MTLPCLIVEPEIEATASVIWLHGLGADGHDFAPIIPELNLPDEHAVRFIFPHAPTLPVTINNGHVMPAWYDILEMSIERNIDIDGLMKSSAEIAKLIDLEIGKGIDSERILLAGFSQGGAVAYQCALTYQKPLAGLLALSTYFATQSVITPAAVNKQIPILICHGTQDPVVPEMLGQMARDQLLTLGYQVEYKTYPVAHNMCADEVADIGKWIGLLL